MDIQEIIDRDLGLHVLHVDLVDQIQGTMLTYHFLVAEAVKDKKFKNLFMIIIISINKMLNKQ